MNIQNPENLNEPAPSDDPLDSYELKQLNDLLSTLCEGMLGEAEARHLGQLLQRSDEARSIYIQYLHMHASLVYSQTNPANVALSGKKQHSLVLRLKEWDIRDNGLMHLRPFVPKIAAGLAAAIVFVGAAIFLWSGSSNTPTPFSRSRVQYVARVVQDVECRWGDETVATVQGGLLHCEDQLNLLEGLAKVRFDSGAEIILRGPASLRIDSGMSCFLNSGELTARVPEVAHGFTVDTPLGRVVDLGTEFGVNVDEEIEVHVFEGELELHPQDYASQQSGSGQEEVSVGLLAGAARRMTLDEQSSKVQVLEMPEPLHQFARSLPLIDSQLRKEALNALAVDSFGQGGPGTRLVGRNGGFGWNGPWISTPDSNSVSFLLGTVGAMSRGSGSGVVQRFLDPGLATARKLFFSAEFRVDGPDPRCSAWLELFKFIPHYWSNGDTDLAVIGITDGQFSGRLAPFTSQHEEQAIGDCGQYLSGSRHLIVGKLEFDAVGDQERLSIWINPSLADERVPNKVIIRDTGQPGADAIAIRCWEMDDETTATFDEVRVGHNWVDVVQ
ncbi:MAG: FecR domain-containing protein [Planctomycetes bacterium]|nr:FecR domain-containing protein [Planctomycetota bacterium]